MPDPAALRTALPAAAGRRFAGVVLAAGAGTRLRPLTDQLPKALCPVGGVPLVDLALSRLAALLTPGPDLMAVNAHHQGDALVAHLAGRAHVSREEPVALGTAGALGALRDWVAGRDVLLTNADLYLPAGLPAGFLASWDGERCRLLCRRAHPGERVDFVAPDGTPARYIGTCLLPWHVVKSLDAVPSGLYEVAWRAAAQGAQPGLDLVLLDDGDHPVVAVDCGTPRDYLLANLHSSAGRSVIGSALPGSLPAVVEGTLERSVVWPGAHVARGEHLVECVRAGTAHAPLTVPAGPLPPPAPPART